MKTLMGLLLAMALPLSAAEKELTLRRAPEELQQMVEKKKEAGWKLYRAYESEDYYKFQLSPPKGETEIYIYSKDLKLLYSYSLVAFVELPQQVQDQIQDNAEVLRKRAELRNDNGAKRHFKRKLRGLKIYTLGDGKIIYYCRWQTHEKKYDGYFDPAGKKVTNFKPVD